MTRDTTRQGHRGIGGAALPGLSRHFLALVAIALTSCGRGEPAGELDIQAHHPNGTVVRVTGIQVGDDRVLVNVLVTNGSGRTIRLSGADDLVLVDDLGNRHGLAAPRHDPAISLQSAATLEGQLTFLGRLHPDARSVTLVTNESRGSDTWAQTPAPRVRLEIPVSRSRARPGSGAPDDSSEIADEAPVSRVTVRPLVESDFTITEVPDGFEIVIRSDALFEFDRHDLLPAARQVLDEIAERIRSLRASVLEIHGHTDSVGDPRYNQTLSERRAAHVRDYLVDEQGLDPASIKTAGYGATKPVAPDTLPDGSDNPEGRRLNRRVEIRVTTAGLSEAR